MVFLLSMYQGIPHSAQMFQNTDFVRHNTLQPGLVADDHINTSEPNQPVVNTAQILSKVSAATTDIFSGISHKNSGRCGSKIHRGFESILPSHTVWSPTAVSVGYQESLNYSASYGLSSR